MITKAEQIKFWKLAYTNNMIGSSGINARENADRALKELIQFDKGLYGDNPIATDESGGKITPDLLKEISKRKDIHYNVYDLVLAYNAGDAYRGQLKRIYAGNSNFTKPTKLTLLEYIKTL